MIKGIGTDIIEVSRMKNQIERDKGFIDNIFTKKEIFYCENFKYKEQNYAGRFAAKEAFFKAIGTGCRNGLAFNHIEIINDDLGKPIIQLSGKTKGFIEQMNVKNIHLSISHTKEYATAIVIIEN